MPHELTVTDKHGNVLHNRKIQTRDDAFTAFDRAVQRDNPDAVEVTLVEDGHTNRRHTFPEKADPEAPAEEPVKEADDEDTKPDPEPETEPVQTAKSGRASNRPVTAASD